MQILFIRNHAQAFVPVKVEIILVPLADGTALDAYKLNDGAKLHLMIKDNKAAASPSDNSNSVRKKTPVVAAVNLEEELSRSLRDE